MDLNDVSNGKTTHELGVSNPDDSLNSDYHDVTEEQRSEIPDGGVRAWVQVVGGFFVYFSTWGLINTFGVFETYYLGILDKSASDIAWIGTVEAFLLVVIGVLIGALHDRGFFRPLLTGGTISILLGIMTTSACKEYWQLFLAQGLTIGLGCGLAFLPSLVVVATYFSKKRGVATGITVAGGQVGGVIFPIVFRQLQPSIGFGWAVRVIGFLVLFSLGIANVVIKPRVPPTRKRLVDLAAFRDPTYVLVCFGLLVTFIGLYQPLYYTPTFGEVVLGMDQGKAFYLSVITNAFSIAGCVLFTMLADRLGALNLIIPAAVITSMLGFLWISVDSVPKLQALVAFYGFFTGALISLPNPILVSLAPSLDSVGTLVGMGYTFAAFGLLIGSPLGGLLINPATGAFLHDQLWTGFFVIGGGMCFAAAKVFSLRKGRTGGL